MKAEDIKVGTMVKIRRDHRSALAVAGLVGEVKKNESSGTVSAYEIEFSDGRVGLFFLNELMEPWAKDDD